MSNSFQPLSDQVLVKLLPFEDRVKSIWVPETVDHGRLPIRQGIVVALGTGDTVALKCEECKGIGLVTVGRGEIIMCDLCGASGYLPHERTTFTVKVGDLVLVHPRPWAETVIDGAPHLVVHEDQHVLAVLEDAA